MTVSSALFSCENVCLSLGGRRILTNVSIDVNPGEIVGLVGPNGAGKTSLFEVLCGRYNQESGKVSMGEQDLSNIAFFQRTRIGLGRTYQSPVTPASLTVGETFRATRKAYKPFLSVHDAEWAARLTNMNVHWDTPAASLGAFDRRCLLLSCLMMRMPKVILMDEPASGLINAEIDELDLIIRQIVDEYAIGVIMIEHRLELLSAVADRVVVLDLGEVIAKGSPEKVFADPKVHAAYFEDAHA